MARLITATYLSSTEDEDELVGKIFPILNIAELGGFEDDGYIYIGEDANTAIKYEVVSLHNGNDVKMII